ncbi:MAG: fumarylacetoacetate hydrolase family protein [SAR324 cluster bacterium]|nr:fumarylacetoacetate hydrolase family protein [SAR324 cluster bacterium]
MSASEGAVSNAGGRLEKLTDWIEARLTEDYAPPEVLQHAPELSVPDAYRVQAAYMARRVAAGDAIAGYKAALTSKAMQEREGFDEPILGTLLTSRRLPANAPVSLGRYLRATLEPEVAVLLKSALVGPGVTAAQALAAVECYLPAVEIGDIRTGDNARSLQQTIVCNTFNGGYVLGGEGVTPAGIDLRYEGMVLEVNGEVAGSATAVEVLGDPINSVAFMANKLGEIGLVLQPGMVLLTGSIVASVRLHPGDEVRVGFTRLGAVRVHCAE